jgi:hypothetical protein
MLKSHSSTKSTPADTAPNLSLWLTTEDSGKRSISADCSIRSIPVDLGPRLSPHILNFQIFPVNPDCKPNSTDPVNRDCEVYPSIFLGRADTCGPRIQSISHESRGQACIPASIQNEAYLPRTPAAIPLVDETRPPSLSLWIS